MIKMVQLRDFVNISYTYTQLDQLLKKRKTSTCFLFVFAADHLLYTQFVSLIFKPIAATIFWASFLQPLHFVSTILVTKRLNSLYCCTSSFEPSPSSSSTVLTGSSITGTACLVNFLNNTLSFILCVWQRWLHRRASSWWKNCWRNSNKFNFSKTN